MVNLVTVDGQRYLVDVGYGSPGPLQPVPLVDGHSFSIVSPQAGKLEYRALSQHLDPQQRVWVYSMGNLDAELREQYCFTETEFFPEDFEVMNLSTMTLPTSYFIQTVLAMVAIVDKKTGAPEGTLTLHKDEIKRHYRGDTTVLETLKNEEQRVKALETYFGVVLNQRDRDAIKGRATELKG